MAMSVLTQLTEASRGQCGMHGTGIPNARNILPILSHQRIGAPYCNVPQPDIPKAKTRRRETRGTNWRGRVVIDVESHLNARRAIGLNDGPCHQELLQLLRAEI